MKMVSSAEGLQMAEKCENLMNIVVESRKRFGKMCVDYNLKASLIEDKMLNLQLKTIANYRHKLTKHQLPKEVDHEGDKITLALQSRQKRIEDLRKRVKDTQTVILQLKSDSVGKKMHVPLTVEALRKQGEMRFTEKQTLLKK